MNTGTKIIDNLLVIIQTLSKLLIKSKNNDKQNIEPLRAQSPYVLLSDITYSIGQTVKACFVEGGDSYFGNDFLPAEITQIRQNGTIELVWRHQIPYLKTKESIGYWHPSCIIAPKHIAVRV